MDKGKIQIKLGKDVVAKELYALRHSMNRGDNKHICADSDSTIDAYLFTVLARNPAGKLVGYVSAFSDELHSTLINELLVHPDYQHRGVGGALLKEVELRYPGLPMHTCCPGDQVGFFIRQGFILPTQDMRLVSKTRMVMRESVCFPVC